MKVRIKFSKYSVMKYIGHLDIMRYFQKSMRRAEIDIAYSGGYSPHQIMSFAAPLGVGIESFGEYFDAEINSGHSIEILNKLNSVMVSGVEITGVRLLPDNAQNAMASIAAAAYYLGYKDDDFKITDYITASDIDDLLAKSSITIIKQTKKQELEFDIRPHIFEVSIEDGYLKLLVDASSSGNLKPLTVLQQMYINKGLEFDENLFKVIRLDMYTRIEGNLVSLGDIGEEF